ncbi:hypothetical protein [Aeromonas salmonicida]
MWAARGGGYSWIGQRARRTACPHRHHG